MNAFHAMRASVNGRGIVCEGKSVVGYVTDSGVLLATDDIRYGGRFWTNFTWAAIQLDQGVKRRIDALNWLPDEPKSALSQFLDYV